MTRLLLPRIMALLASPLAAVDEPPGNYSSNPYYPYSIANPPDGIRTCPRPPTSLPPA